MHPYLYTGINYINQRQFLANRSVNQLDLAEAIKLKISKWFKIRNTDLTSQTRKREVVKCRQVCMYFIKLKTTLSLKVIGKMFGGRDHTTVIYALKTVTDVLTVDREFSQMIIKIERLLSLKTIDKNNNNEPADAN